jgi:hypothetical protein
LRLQRRLALGQRWHGRSGAVDDSIRRYLFPRLLMPSSFGLPPVVCCFGTSPSQAPRSRPRLNAAPSPTAATKAVAQVDAQYDYCHGSLLLSSNTSILRMLEKGRAIP